MVRIFVSPSHLSTLYMILYARKTHKEGYKDILILDSPPKKSSHKKLIIDTQKIYNWHTVIDLSITLPDESDYRANTRKQFTRKLKDKALIKPIYDFLLKRHFKKKQKMESKTISDKLKDLGEVTEVNVLTQTLINGTLFTLFPKATVNYFEHGIGDYFFVQKIKDQNFNFYCVFDDEFKKLLQGSGQNFSYVKKLPGQENFPEIAKEVIENADAKEEIKKLFKVEGKMVLILLEAMQIFNVPDNYYTDYIDLCISQIDKPDQYTFVLKPHPFQTRKSIEDSKNHILNKYKLKTLIIEENAFINYSVEVLFVFWKDATEYVFGVYSSSLFYNSVLYKNNQTKYFYSYEFLEPYTKDAPQQFMEIYRGIKEIVKNVFSANCTSMIK